MGNLDAVLGPGVDFHYFHMMILENTCDLELEVDLLIVNVHQLLEIFLEFHEPAIGNLDVVLGPGMDFHYFHMMILELEVDLVYVNVHQLLVNFLEFEELAMGNLHLVLGPNVDFHYFHMMILENTWEREVEVDLVIVNVHQLPEIFLKFHEPEIGNLEVVLVPDVDFHYFHMMILEST